MEIYIKSDLNFINDSWISEAKVFWKLLIETSHNETFENILYQIYRVRRIHQYL